MLVHLHVKNLALIEEAEVDFEEGLNILTGETGAGKSILIGSVNLALGQKMSREMIREGADHAYVELVFQVNPDTEEKLKKLEVFPEEGQVIISRRFTENRSISKINGETTTISGIRNGTNICIMSKWISVSKACRSYSTALSLTFQIFCNLFRYLQSFIFLTVCNNIKFIHIYLSSSL